MRKLFAVRLPGISGCHPPAIFAHFLARPDLAAIFPDCRHAWRMESAQLNALLDSDIRLDFLDGHAPAAREIARYRECCISITSWMEVMAGAGTRFASTMSCILSYADQVPLVETTLTIRLSGKQREVLKRRAAAEKRSESALVRDLIDREINRGFDFNRVRHLVGSIAGSPRHWTKDPWRKHIRQRNWRR